MTTKTLTLSADERSTIRIALHAWIGRCEAEAKQMRQWAAEETENPDTAAQCLRNANASDHFRERADALVAKFKEYM